MHSATEAQDVQIIREGVRLEGYREGHVIRSHGFPIYHSRTFLRLSNKVPIPTGLSKRRGIFIVSQNRKIWT